MYLLYVDESGDPNNAMKIILSWVESLYLSDKSIT
jgi:hypothetical protein